MLLRFLQSALKFIVAVLSLRSNHSVFLLDASDYSNDLLHKSISNTKGRQPSFVFVYCYLFFIYKGTTLVLPTLCHQKSMNRVPSNGLQQQPTLESTQIPLSHMLPPPYHHFIPHLLWANLGLIGSLKKVLHQHIQLGKRTPSIGYQVVRRYPLYYLQVVSIYESSTNHHQNQIVWLNS